MDGNQTVPLVAAVPGQVNLATVSQKEWVVGPRAGAGYGFRRRPGPTAIPGTHEHDLRILAVILPLDQEYVPSQGQEVWVAGLPFLASNLHGMGETLPLIGRIRIEHALTLGAQGKPGDVMAALAIDGESGSMFRTAHEFPTVKSDPGGKPGLTVCRGLYQAMVADVVRVDESGEGHGSPVGVEIDGRPATFALRVGRFARR